MTLGRGESPLEGRLGFLAGVLCFTFAVFVFRLFQLQIVEGADLRERSQRNSVRTERLEAPRGEILDREGRVLATTRPAFDVGVIPSEVRSADAEVTFTALAQLLERDPEALRTRLGAPRGRARFQPVVLAPDLPHEPLARVEAHRFALPGVVTEVRPLREYPREGLFAHVLGTIGEVSAGQLEQRAFAGYRPGEIVGKSGLEGVLESELRGRAGGRNVVVDVAGREVEVLDEVEPQRGHSAVLTLDLDLQRAAAEAFREAAPEGEPASGAVVALDPRDGAVRVLASFPAFDPNAFADGIDAERWRALTEDPLRPLQDRVLSGQFPPGSTYKPVVAAAALEEGLVTPTTRWFCPGSFTLGNRTYRCWKRGGHGWVDLRDALVQSCDVYFYQVGVKLGVDRLAWFARAFGLGRPTGIELPQEQAGLVPTSAWKENRFREPWMRGETVSISIGQGFNLTTPIQLAVAYAAVANGGRVVVPRLVDRVLGEGAVLRAPSPRERGRVPVAPEHLERVRRAMTEVVEAPDGTGKRARVPGVEVAGKTGTAQVVRLDRLKGYAEDEIPRRYRDHAWFGAFAPAGDPEIVVVVLVEHGGGGGANAAPIAQRVLARWWEKKSAPAAGATVAAAGEEGPRARR